MKIKKYIKFIQKLWHKCFVGRSSNKDINFFKQVVKSQFQVFII